MQFEIGCFYHLYNRTNNNEIAFKEHENYLFFLKKYRKNISQDVDTFAYILMPTHFHFLVRVNTQEINKLKKKIGHWQSSYTRAINKACQRHGSLFQLHTKAIEIDDEGYLISVINYIHQNALRAGLVKKLEYWPYSSYPDLVGFRNGTLPDRDLVKHFFKTIDEFREYSKQLMTEINERFWVYPRELNGRYRSS